MKYLLGDFFHLAFLDILAHGEIISIVTGGITINTDAKKLRNNLQSYMLVVLIGLAVGLVTRLSDFFPNDTLWAFSSIATLFGFWIVTATLIIYFSSSNINAAVNAFLYLFSMSFSFYFFYYIFGFFSQRFYNEGFNWNLFILYAMGSLMCGIVGYILYYWNRGGRIGSVLYALPIGGLLAEIVGVAIYLYVNHVYLFQLVFNVLSIIILGTLFWRKAQYKSVYVAAIAVTALTVYFAFYHAFV